ncbi:MAG: hypothetical protein ACLQO7_05945 [Candidatus Bathyarchaeia archaeon]
MPLDQNVTFPAVLEKGNRAQIPKTIVWQFKMESTQTLQVAISGRGGYENFCAKNGQRRCIYVPKNILFTLFGKAGNLTGTLWK